MCCHYISKIVITCLMLCLWACSLNLSVVGQVDERGSSSGEDYVQDFPQDANRYPRISKPEFQALLKKGIFDKRTIPAELLAEALLQHSAEANVKLVNIDIT